MLGLHFSDSISPSGFLPRNEGHPLEYLFSQLRHRACTSTAQQPLVQDGRMVRDTGGHLNHMGL